MKKPSFSISKIKTWYTKYERPVSSLALVSGFVFNAITLKRVDFFWENFWVLMHLAIVATCIILINLKENTAGDIKETGKAHFWYITIMQFTFGGLLSTYLVFYFRSTTLSVTWPFLLLLIFAFLANESLKKHYTRLTLQISLFFLSLYSFAIFIVPVFFHKIGQGIFLISGIISLLILWLFLYFLRSISREKLKSNMRLLILSISGIFITINILYIFRLIPPIPLSLKDGGIYHSVFRDSNGNYTVQAEQSSWFKKFLNYFSRQDFHAVLGDPVYAYSAIFSPASFRTDVVHEWQLYDETTKRWITKSRLALSVSGGREGGYRTYSKKADVTVGKWRVNVETKNGQIIGRLRFNVISVGIEPILVDIAKE